jgi:hypothetical protein
MVLFHLNCSSHSGAFPPLPTGEGRGEGTHVAQSQTAIAQSLHHRRRAHESHWIPAFAGTTQGQIPAAQFWVFFTQNCAAGMVLFHPNYSSNFGAFPPLPLGEGRGEGTHVTQSQTTIAQSLHHRLHAHKSHWIPAFAGTTEGQIPAAQFWLIFTQNCAAGIALLHPNCSPQPGAFPPLPSGEGRGEGTHVTQSQTTFPHVFFNAHHHLTKAHTPKIKALAPHEKCCKNKP